MIVLGIETSCDDTSASVVADARVLSNIVSSQDDVHEAYGGVVPELAARRHLESIQAIVARAIESAGVAFGDLDAVAVTRGPGLVGSLLVGMAAAEGIALRLGVPLFGVNHLEGHVLSPLIEATGRVSVPLPLGLRRTYGAVSRQRRRRLSRSGRDQRRLCRRSFRQGREDARARISGGPSDRSARQGRASRCDRFPARACEAGRDGAQLLGIEDRSLGLPTSGRHVVSSERRVCLVPGSDRRRATRSLRACDGAVSTWRGSRSPAGCRQTHGCGNERRIWSSGAVDKSCCRLSRFARTMPQ